MKCVSYSYRKTQQKRQFLQFKCFTHIIHSEILDKEHFFCVFANPFCFGLAATKVVSHLIEKLPGNSGDKWPPTEVIINIIAVLNNLVVESPVAARDIVYFDGLRKLFYIKKKRDRYVGMASNFHPYSILTSLLEQHFTFFNFWTLLQLQKISLWPLFQHHRIYLLDSPNVQK